MERRTTPSVLNVPGTNYTFALMADSKVMLYTTDPCGFCRSAKALLAARGIDYVEEDLARDPEGRERLLALTGQMTFPQVIVDGQPIGGFRELLEAHRSGRLDALLAP
jgi:glutaredoxin 3